MPNKPAITCPACEIRGKKCHECRLEQRRANYAKHAQARPLNTCQRCEQPREPGTSRWCKVCAVIVQTEQVRERNKRYCERMKLERAIVGHQKPGPKPKPPSEKKPRKKKAKAAKPEKISKNRHGAGLVIYHGEAASKNRKPVKARVFPQVEINDLERKCCNRRYWLRRVFFPPANTVAYWVADDGREFTACPKCGKEAK